MERLTTRIDGVIAIRCEHAEICPKRQKCIETQLCEAGKFVLERLESYEDAEEQGLLIRLPCKVGDTVYKLGCECHLGNTYLNNIDCDECEDACDLMRVAVEYKAPSVEWIIRNMTGKRPFAYTTREEAEAAIAKEE